MLSLRCCLVVALMLSSQLCVFAAGDAQDAVAVRERFLGMNGLPSEEAYESACGILPAPGSESYDWTASFKLTYLTADLTRPENARPIQTDCYFTRRHKYAARFRAEPVWDGRVYSADGRLRVGAYSKKCEQFAGYVDPDTCTVRLESNDASSALPKLDGVRYNPFTGQLWRRVEGGEISEQTRLFLPLPLMNEQGEAATPKFKIATGDDGTCRLLAGHDGHEQTLASCKLGDIDKQHGKPGYTPTLGPGCAMITGDPTTVVEIAGKINREALDASGSQLVLRGASSSRAPSLAPVKIDGRFDEWRSRHGIVDPEGDFVSYLQYKPDTDLLELKVANDERHLYFYTRVAGRHGYTAPGRDRYYFYIYIDADRNPNTGYVPTRDDDCYYGVALGDDCEAQFEFVGGRFVKTFFGFAGNGSEKQILTGQVRLGPSWYNRYDDAKQLRDSYKVEIVKRGGALSITEDFTEGTSDDIQIALSPDGSECEMRVEMSGFLKDAAGKPIIAPGQSIDLAAGVEASGESDGQSKWSADSTAVWHGYAISAGDSK